MPPGSDDRGAGAGPRAAHQMAHLLATPQLEADIKTVGVTLTAILGVIIFWRGVWSLLDHYIGDSVVGDICCSVLGLCIILYIRLSGAKLASFWPPS